MSTTTSAPLLFLSHHPTDLLSSYPSCSTSHITQPQIHLQQQILQCPSYNGTSMQWPSPYSLPLLNTHTPTPSCGNNIFSVSHHTPPPQPLPLCEGCDALSVRVCALEDLLKGRILPFCESALRALHEQRNDVCIAHSRLSLLTNVLRLSLQPSHQASSSSLVSPSCSTDNTNTHIIHQHASSTNLINQSTATDNGHVENIGQYTPTTTSYLMSSVPPTSSPYLSVDTNHPYSPICHPLSLSPIFSCPSDASTTTSSLICSKELRLDDTSGEGGIGEKIEVSSLSSRWNEMDVTGREKDERDEEVKEAGCWLTLSDKLKEDKKNLFSKTKNCHTATDPIHYTDQSLIDQSSIVLDGDTSLLSSPLPELGHDSEGQSTICVSLNHANNASASSHNPTPPVSFHSPRKRGRPPKSCYANRSLFMKVIRRKHSATTPENRNTASNNNNDNSNNSNSNRSIQSCVSSSPVRYRT
eukprot:GHVQ01037634.1.p2 GENE.GHVQ01037634.1~~GHVQ01037634.1.p2  ORF type:complete len:470 (-),score=89.05 GHVQ01037634.1:3426-4835(-)